MGRTSQLTPEEVWNINFFEAFIRRSTNYLTDFCDNLSDVFDLCPWLKYGATCYQEDDEIIYYEIECDGIDKKFLKEVYSEGGMRHWIGKFIPERKVIRWEKSI